MPDYQPLILYRETPLTVPWPVTGAFGQTRDPWTAARPHLGVDFGCPTGTSVLASCYGRLTTLSVDDGSFGTYALIDCTTEKRAPTEWYMLHAHLSSAPLDIGTLVKPGDVIGYSGATGTVTGPHLHWQMSRNRKDFPRDIAHMADPFSFPRMGDFDGPAVDELLDAFSTLVCGGMGLEPTEWRLDFLAEWADYEDDGRWRLLREAHNPLATTRLTERRTGSWNSAGVGIYEDIEAGVQATLETLALDYYPNIRKALKEQEWNAGLETEFVTWIGSPGYAKALSGYIKDLDADRGYFVSADELDTEALNEAIQKRMAIIRLANDPDLAKVEAAFNLLRTEALL